MGALDSSLVAPARRVIEQELGVDSTLGVWMLTLYTLVYAVSLPIIGKLSDLWGRAKVFKASVILFALGALVAGIADLNANFTILLIGRAIQAMGGGGIMPVATAEISALFPPEKRGTALGLLGATYGIAAILGPTIGSSILDAFGAENWGWLFFLQLPLAVAPFIPGMGLDAKDKSVQSSSKRRPLDLPGTTLIAVCLLSLMYGLTNFKLSDVSTFFDADVWPFIVGALVLMPLIVAVERKANDPVIDMGLFKNKEVVLALIVSTFTGICLMGVIFIPQWAENLLRIPTGKGGYIVTAMSIFAGGAAPIGGRLVDKWGARQVILMGFCFVIAGCLLMVYWATSLWQILVTLACSGLGIGFTMGTPLNYLILSFVPVSRSGSALAVLSLFRSIGTTLAPNLMASYLVDAGKRLMPEFKATVSAFELMPDTQGTAATAVTKSMKILETADVTTIVAKIEEFLKGLDGIPIFVKPMIVAQVKTNAVAIEDTFQRVMNGGFGDIYLTTAILALGGFVVALAMARRPDFSVASEMPTAIQTRGSDGADRDEDEEGESEPAHQAADPAHI